MLHFKKISITFKVLLYCIVFVSILLFSYIRAPSTLLYQYNDIKLPLFEESSLFIIFPGYWGPDIYTDHLLKVVKESDQILGEARYIMCYDLKKYIGNILRAAIDYENVGKALGEQVALLSIASKEQGSMNKKLRVVNIHVVGISMGSFAAQSFVETYKSKIIDIYGMEILSSISINLTFLDPYVNRGFFERDYGLINFGIDADYAEQYLNTDDFIPFTNQPLLNTYTIDITKSFERNKFKSHTKDITMHSWPVEYYALHFKNDLDPRLKNSHANHIDQPRGTIHLVL